MLMMGIEAPLMTDAQGKIFDKFYELPNGCVCCSAKDDLMVAIEYFINNQEYKLDYILIETNGLTDPTSMIKNYWVDEEMKYPAKLRSVISVVAAHKVEEQIQNQIYTRQLLFADLILINHTDQIKPQEIEPLKERLLDINPFARLELTNHSNIDVKVLFATEGYEARKDRITSFIEKHGTGHIHNKIGYDFVTMEFGEEPFEKNELEKNLGILIWEKPNGVDIVRVKGIAVVKDSEYIYSIQGVDEVFEMKESQVKWSEESKRVTKILFIGKNLNDDFIRGAVHGLSLIHI
eukprot:TRINITY_DN10896_c0_g1_i5.p1 TRINITY_DN10896_c0_g1~~TRINITY_DN10896_c0_g1_i5.p1  ORF type:complete len:292 (+),score=81.81 TRINITY_DN10896_c0_g1_i5:296-1171(+)